MRVDIEEKQVKDNKKKIILNKYATKEMLKLYERGEVLVNHKELAKIIGFQTRTAIDQLQEFNKKVQQGFYPKESFINPNTKTYLVWIKPLLHYFMFKNLYGTKMEKFIPKFTNNFFDEVM